MILKSWKWRWPALFAWACMAVGINLSVSIYDRFLGNTNYGLFYVDGMDLTCLTTTYKGEGVMWCIPGQHIEENPKP